MKLRTCSVPRRDCIRSERASVPNHPVLLWFQIDVDIGSSSVARSVVGLVLGYVTSVVVDLAILIEVLHQSMLAEAHCPVRLSWLLPYLNRE